MTTRSEILYERQPTSAPPEDPIGGSIVWKGETLDERDGLIILDERSLSELDAIAALLRDNPLPVEMLEPEAFELTACRRVMAEAHRMLSEGVGFVIIDRLPLEHYSRQEASALYWLLAQLVSRPVAQNWAGKLVYDIRDFGKPPGNGVRPDVTNAEQAFHTDNSYNLCPPDYVALLCLQPAMEGGVSSIVSFPAVFNEMRRESPHLLGRLFEPYLFDRNREHAPDAPPVVSHPLMQSGNGSIRCRLSRTHVVNGYRMAGIEMDALGMEALEALETTMRNPRLARNFFFEPGQIQIIDNSRLGHRRSGFVDFPEEERRRHLVRLWLRNSGRRFYNG